MSSQNDRNLGGKRRRESGRSTEWQLQLGLDWLDPAVSKRERRETEKKGEVRALTAARGKDAKGAGGTLWREKRDSSTLPLKLETPTLMHLPSEKRGEGGNAQVC